MTCCLLIYLLLPAGCSAMPSPIQTTQYRPLTVEQIKSYVKEKESTLREYVTPLAIKSIRNLTVIQFETDTLWGSYALTSGEDGRISVCGGGVSNDFDLPVSIVSYGCSEPEWFIGFTEIRINDDNLLEHAYSVKIALDDKTELSEFVNGSRGFIFLHPGGGQTVSWVVISNKDMDILYENTMN